MPVDAVADSGTNLAVPAVPSRTLLGVALVSGSLLMTELSLTRIFSVTMYYHFAFMAISIALFGLSASGVYVFLLRDRWASVATDRLLASHALAYAALTAIALAVLVQLRVGLTYTPANIALMSVMYLVSALPFFAGGAAISLAISRLSAQVNAVYAADLLGAGTGCLLLMPALNNLGAPGAIVMSSLLGASAALCFASPAARRALAVRAGVFVLIVGAATAAGAFSVSTTKGHADDRVLFSKWNSFSRIAVYDAQFGGWALSDRYHGPVPEARLMDIDSAAATQILKFGGDLRDVSYLQYELTAFGYRLVGAPGASGAAGDGDPPAGAPFSALVIGTGGGRDLLSALVFGASSVDGVEINPIIVNDVMRGKFRGYSGGVYDRPDVHVTVEDGRSFVRRSAKRYDLIQASLVDTWAATSAGAYALSENSLYTVEAFEDYLDHLTDRGVLSITRWVYDGLRLVSLAQEAGTRHGWDPKERLAIIQHDRMATFLLKAAPFTTLETQMLSDDAARLGFVVLYMPGRTVAPVGDSRDDYARLLLSPDRQAFYRAYPFDVTPTTDDRPFFFHTTKLRNHWLVARIARLLGMAGESADNPGIGATGGLTALLALLGISSTLTALFVAGPLVITSRRGLGHGWFRSLAYFACLGGAFMLLEVALLQRFVLLLGHPVYSLTVTLFSLLLGTGLGSVLSRRVRDARVRRAAVLACAAVAGVALLWGSVLPPLVQSAIGWPLPLRIALAIALMAPAGMLMGIPLPAGVRLLSATQPQLVAWAWGMNGALSVLGATLAVFIAMNWGFSATLLCGAAGYGLAALLASRSPSLVSRRA